MTDSGASEPHGASDGARVDRRPPWEPPAFFENSREVWLRARALGDEPELEWSFPELTQRLLATAPSGLAFGYEHLTSWDEATRALILAGLLAEHGFDGSMGMGISIGFEVFDSALRSTTGRFALPSSSEQFRGRHLVAAVTWDPNREEIVIRNSWGSWGDGGYGYIGKAYFEAHVDNVMLTRPTWLGPSPAADTEARAFAWRRGTPNQVDVSAWLHAWRTPNTIKAKTASIIGREHEVRLRQLYSFADGHPLDVVELREADELKGRLHLLHNRQLKQTTMTEFWIPPNSRRQGYGRYLATTAQELAQSVKSVRLHLPLYEVDASSIGRVRAMTFGTSLGYDWHWHTARRPNTVGFAVKVLPQ